MMLGNQPRWSLALHPFLNWLKPGLDPELTPAKVLSITDECSTTYSVWLEPDASWSGFKPGQHVNLAAELNGRLLKRTFSISSSFEEWQQHGRLRLTLKINPEGQVSRQLSQAIRQSNVTWLSLSEAKGDFCWSDPNQSSLFFAAGSGITPIASMLLSQKVWSAEAELVYYVRSRLDAALLADLEALAARQPLFRFKVVETSHEGRLAFEKAVTAGFKPKQLLSCGPFAFTEAALAFGKQQGLDDSAMQREYFHLPQTQKGDDSQAWQVNWLTDEGEVSQSAASSQSLLASAEQAGLAPVHGCRIGVCYQCVCQKKSGVVRDIRTGLLSGDGEEQIQLCVSVPQSMVSVRLGDPQ